MDYLIIGVCNKNDMIGYNQKKILTWYIVNYAMYYVMEQ